jgi:hypothetical protein
MPAINQTFGDRFRASCGRRRQDKTVDGVEQKDSYKTKLCFSLDYVTCSEKSQPTVVEDLWVSLNKNGHE